MSGPENLQIKRESFPAGETICHEGEVCPFLFILLRGEIQILSGDRVIQLIRKKGSIAGEISSVYGRCASVTIKTLTDTDCLVVPVDYIEEIMSRNPEEEIHLLGVLASHILKNEQTFPELARALDEAEDMTEMGENDTQKEYRNMLYVAVEKDNLDIFRHHFTALGFEVSFYDDPAVVIQELDSIDPDVIVFEADDFPRHWKPLLKILRDCKGMEEVVFLLMAGRDFSFDEAAKAAHLGINGIIPRQELDKRMMYRVGELIRRYKSLDDRRKFSRVIPTDLEQFHMLFTHPIKRIFIQGTVNDISLEGTSFLPLDSQDTEDLKVDQRIPHCSLRVGKDIIAVNCRVACNQLEIGLEFESFEEDGHEKLFQYLMERPEREMKYRHQVS